MKIVLGSDHNGYELKKEIEEHLTSFGFLCEDLGTFSKEETQYPLYVKRSATAVAGKKYDKGIFVSATGVGAAMCANKIENIRCAFCTEPFSALSSRQFEDSNFLCLASQITAQKLALMIVDTWLTGEFEKESGEKIVELINQTKLNPDD